MPVLNMLTSSELGPLLSPIANDVDDSRLITDSGRIINSFKVRQADMHMRVHFEYVPSLLLLQSTKKLQVASHQ